MKKREVITNKGSFPSVWEAARRFHVTPATIRSWCRVGNSPTGIIFELGKLHQEEDMPRYSKSDPILVKTYGRKGNIYLLYVSLGKFEYKLYLYHNGIKIHLFTLNSVYEADKIINDEI